jgi:hypothetical protein
MDWLFDGLGTLLIGLVIGGGGGSAIGWKLAIRKTRQTQRAGNYASQTQIGGDQQITRGNHE